MAAGYQRGNMGAGLTTTIGMPGAAGSLFQVVSYFWQSREENKLKERFGRDTSGTLNFRFMRVGGGILVRGDIPGTQPPQPDSWAGQSTSLVITFAATKTITFTVVVESFAVDGQQPGSDLYGFTATLKITSKATYSEGWGTAAVGGSVTKSDVRMYDGSSFTHDPDGLQTAATIVVDWWTLAANTDAGLKTRLTDAIATYVATGFTSTLKNRIDVIHQDADDGGVMIFNHALTTTAEDALNEATGRLDDPSDLQDSETTAAFNSTPGSGTISGLVSRGIVYKEYNDSMVMQVKRWGRTTTEQDITFPGTYITTDKSTIPIRTTQIKTEISGSGSEPSFTPSGALKSNTWTPIQQTDAGKVKHVHEARLTTPQEEVENEGSTLHVDAAGIGTFEVHRRVVATVSTADPDSGSVTSGLVIHNTETKEIHDNAFARSFDYRLMNAATEIEHRGSTSRGGTNGILTAPSTAPTIQTAVSTVTAPDTSQSLALAGIVTAQAVTTRPWRSLSVTKLNPLKAATRIEVPGDDFMVFVGVPTVSQERRSVDATGSNVSVQDGYALTSGTSRVYLGHFTHNVVRFPVVLRRWRRATSPTGLFYPAIIGCKNSGTGSGAAAGTVTLSGGAITGVATGTGGSGYSTGDVGVVVVGGGGSGAIITATTSTTSAVTGYTVVNGGAGYTSTPTIYVTGGNTFFGITSACWVYRGPTTRFNLREEGVAHWVCIDYAFEVVAINSGSGALIDGNLFNGNIPQDAWTFSISALPTIPSQPAASSIRAAYVSGTVPASIGWGNAFFGQ